MGSFHLGGREAVMSGKPVREVVFTSHMMMMDKNNLAVADVIQTWLERERLYR